MEALLDGLHARARATPPLQRLAIISRVLLALAFIPTGMVKVLGERFTRLPIDSPVGFFFEAMYQTGLYWHFLGWSQVIAGVLLLIPATQVLGALATFPLVLNIFLITVSIDFNYTPVITGGMLLAALFLVCWEWDRLKVLFFARDIVARRPPPAQIGRLEKAGYITGTIAGLVVLGWTRSFVSIGTRNVFLLVGLVAVLMVAVAWIREVLPARRDVRTA